LPVCATETPKRPRRLYRNTTRGLGQGPLRERLDRHLHLHRHGVTTAVGLDDQPAPERLGAGAQALATDPDGDDGLVAGLEALLGGARPLAEHQPGAIGGDGTVEQALPLVAQAQLEAAVGAGRQGPQVHLGGADLRAGGLDGRVREPGEELVQAAVGIGEAAGLLRGLG
jgi:hypothetical protein